MKTEPSSHWASFRESGSMLGMRIMLGAYQIGGDYLFRLFLLPPILFYSLFNIRAQRASRQYREIMHAYNSKFPSPKPWHTFKHLWSFAVTLLDKLAVWMEKINRDDVILHNVEIIDQLLSRKQGAVILISHLGNFEICQALSESHPGFRLTALHHTKHTQKFNQFLQRKSRETTVQFMQVTDLGASQAMQLSERLSIGEFVAISADRVALDNNSRTQEKEFLGRIASFPTGPFKLASALQVPVLSIQCIREGKDNRYNIYFNILDDGDHVPRKLRNEKLDQLIDDYVTNLESCCLKAPWQWYNFYPFWPNSTGKTKRV